MEKITVTIEADNIVAVRVEHEAHVTTNYYKADEILVELRPRKATGKVYENIEGWWWQS